MPDVPNQENVPQAPKAQTTVQQLAEHRTLLLVVEGVKSHGEVPVKLIFAEGGPYDGEELTIPPAASVVVLPGMFGKTGDFNGPVIYKKQGDKMVYMGQPDQTEAIAEELAARDG